MHTCTHTVMQYFPDRFVMREINSLEMICPYAKAGCNWEGKFGEYFNHESKCTRGLSTMMPDVRIFAINASPSQSLDLSGTLSFELVPSCESLQCPLSPFGCSERFMDRDQLNQHLQENQCDHLMMLINHVQLLEENLRDHDSNMNEQRRYQDPLPERISNELQLCDEEIAALRSQVVRMEKQIRSMSADLEDRDFRLSLIENSNHDGTIIWKIPQFSQRKADAENSRYTSILSLPFYSGRYGYKMCLRLYIMGDGIGKGTHLSLFFVVMRGEFDNILQWPFTHKVTFKLINQEGGRDIVDTFQPDPVSSSFRKPSSDMNVASGCPRFVSHAELERGGFVVDDTIFLKCVIDTSTIRHP